MDLVREDQIRFLEQLDDHLGFGGSRDIFSSDLDVKSIYTAAILDKYDFHVASDRPELQTGTLATALKDLRGEVRGVDRDRGSRKLDKWMRQGGIQGLIDKYLERISSDETAARRAYVYSGLEEAPEIITTDEGISVVGLTTYQDMVAESDFQGHCIGTSRFHSDQLVEGKNRYFPLRHEDGDRFTLDVSIDRREVNQLRGKNDRSLSIGRDGENFKKFVRAVNQTIVTVEDEIKDEISVPSDVFTTKPRRHFLMTRDGEIVFPDISGFTSQQMDAVEQEGIRDGRLSVLRLKDERLRKLISPWQYVDIGVTPKITSQQLGELLPSGTELSGTLSIERCNPVTLPENLTIGRLRALLDSGLAEWRNDTIVTKSALIDTELMRDIEGFNGVQGDLDLRNLRDGILPDSIEIGGKLTLYGDSLTQLPDTIKAKRISLKLKNVRRLGDLVCEELQFSSLENIDQIGSGSKIGTLYVTPKSLINLLENDGIIPGTVESVKLHHYSKDIIQLVNLLLKKSGVKVSIA